MAENFVNVTEGSGKKLHTFNRTIGANDVHDEGVFVAEQNLASYIATHGSSGVSSSAATANSHMYQLMAGSSLKLRIRRIEGYQETLATTVTHAQFRLYRLTTAGTGGTSETPSVLDPSDAAAGATGMRLPTVKGTEGNLIAMAIATLVQTAAASTRFAEPCLVWDFDRLRSKPLIVSAGTSNGIAIKNVSAVAAATMWFNIWFDESNF